MAKNFRCPETGNEFLISQFSTVFNPSGSVYKDRWGKQIVNENGVPLELIPKDHGGEYRVNIIRNDTGAGNRYERSVAHHNKVAADYNKSDEVKEMKYKAVEREMGTSIAAEDKRIQERVRDGKKIE